MLQVFCCNNIWKKQVGDILLKMNNLKEEIKIARESNNLEKLKKMSNEIIKEWEKIDEVWSMVIIHQELDDIKLSILTVNGALEAGNIEDALEEIDKTIFLTSHVKEKELFRLKNLF